MPAQSNRRAAPSYGTVYDQHGDAELLARHDQKAYVAKEVDEEDTPLASSAPPVAVGIPLYPDCPEPAAVRFSRRGWNDVWAAILFVACVAVVIFTATGVNIHKDFTDAQRAQLKLFGTIAPIAAVVCLALSVGAVFVMRARPAGYIYATFVCAALIAACLMLQAFWAGYTLIGIVWLLMLCATLFMLYMLPSIMQFSVVVLETAAALILRHPGILVTAFVAFLVLAAFFVIVCTVAVPLSAKLNEQHHGGKVSAGTVWALIGLLLMVFWSLQVALGVVHVVSSGTTALWFFLGQRSVPANPTVPIVRRSVTTSFGSICFGSLVVAIVETVYWLVRTQESSDNEFARCIAVCIMGMLRDLVEKFNMYGLVHVAIYGTSYIESCKLTWEFVQEFFLAAYFNDCLVFPVVTMTSLVLGLGTGLVTYFVTGDAAASWAVGVVVMSTCMIFLRPVYASAITQLVCLAEAQDVVDTANPEYSSRINDAVSASHHYENDRMSSRMV